MTTVMERPVAVPRPAPLQQEPLTRLLKVRQDMRNLVDHDLVRETPAQIRTWLCAHLEYLAQVPQVSRRIVLADCSGHLLKSLYAFFGQKVPMLACAQLIKYLHPDVTELWIDPEGPILLLCPSSVKATDE